MGKKTYNDLYEFRLRINNMEKQIKTTLHIITLLSLSFNVYSSNESTITDGFNFSKNDNNSSETSDDVDSDTTFDEEISTLTKIENIKNYSDLKNQFETTEEFLNYVEQNELYDIIDAKNKSMD